MTTTFSIDTLLPYLDWNYFFRAWQVADAPEEVKDELKTEAMELLAEWEDKTVKVLAIRSRASRAGDEIVTDILRFPCPRQKNEPYLCLADFVGDEAEVTFYATSFDVAPSDDVYRQMLQQTLSDRLAEAASAKLSEELAKENGGLAFAVGYPSLPDQSLMFDFDRAMDLSQIGITLTETGMMVPHASVCCIFVPGKDVKYFSVC